MLGLLFLTGLRVRVHIVGMRLFLSFAAWLTFVVPVYAQGPAPDDGARAQAVRIIMQRANIGALRADETVAENVVLVATNLRHCAVLDR